MADRVAVTKTWKLFIGGAFPRTESGRSIAFQDGSGRVVAHLCHGSRKDLRDAVESAHAAQPKWAAASGYLRGQILYRLAEMIEGRTEEFVAALRQTGRRGRGSAEREVAAAVEMVVSFAGWCDKLDSVLGNRNCVNGDYYNFSAPEPVGVVMAIGPSDAPMLGSLAMILPALAAGNSVVLLAPESEPIPALLLAETSATADIPPGVINVLSGVEAELAPHIASHREIDAIVAAVEVDTASLLAAGVAENLKRVSIIDPSADFTEERFRSPVTFSAAVNIKTIWHPIAQ